MPMRQQQNQLFQQQPIQSVSPHQSVQQVQAAQNEGLAIGQLKRDCADNVNNDILSNQIGQIDQVSQGQQQVINGSSQGIQLLNNVQMLQNYIQNQLIANQQQMQLSQNNQNQNNINSGLMPGGPNQVYLQQKQMVVLSDSIMKLQEQQAVAIQNNGLGQQIINSSQNVPPNQIQNNSGQINQNQYQQANNNQEQNDVQRGQLNKSSRQSQSSGQQQRQIQGVQQPIMSGQNQLQQQAVLNFSSFGPPPVVQKHNNQSPNVQSINAFGPLSNEGAALDNKQKYAVGVAGQVLEQNQHVPVEGSNQASGRFSNSFSFQASYSSASVQDRQDRMNAAAGREIAPKLSSQILEQVEEEQVDQNKNLSDSYQMKHVVQRKLQDVKNVKSDGADPDQIVMDQELKVAQNQRNRHSNQDYVEVRNNSQQQQSWRIPLGNELPIIHERKKAAIMKKSLQGERSRVSSGREREGGEQNEDEAESDVLEMISYMIDQKNEQSQQMMSRYSQINNLSEIDPKQIGLVDKLQAISANEQIKQRRQVKLKNSDGKILQNIRNKTLDRRQKDLQNNKSKISFNHIIGNMHNRDHPMNPIRDANLVNNSYQMQRYPSPLPQIPSLRVHGVPSPYNNSKPPKFPFPNSLLGQKKWLGGERECRLGEGQDIGDLMESDELVAIRNTPMFGASKRPNLLQEEEKEQYDNNDAQNLRKGKAPRAKKNQRQFGINDEQPHEKLREYRKLLKSIDSYEGISKYSGVQLDKLIKLEDKSGKHDNQNQFMSSPQRSKYAQGNKLRVSHVNLPNIPGQMQGQENQQDRQQPRYQQDNSGGDQLRNQRNQNYGQENRQDIDCVNNQGSIQQQQNQQPQGVSILNNDQIHQFGQREQIRSSQQNNFTNQDQQDAEFQMPNSHAQRESSSLVRHGEENVAQLDEPQMMDYQNNYVSVQDKSPMLLQINQDESANQQKSLMDNIHQQSASKLSPSQPLQQNMIAFGSPNNQRAVAAPQDANFDQQNAQQQHRIIQRSSLGSLLNNKQDDQR